MVHLDLQYIDNWSLMLDAKLILQTFVILFTRKGARYVYSVSQ
ncbi:MAG: sugar transferase [Blautia sp.]|nr:sugar transferase [Blautia sp.]